LALCHFGPGRWLPFAIWTTLIRSGILALLDNATLYRVAQVAWVLHDDAVTLLEERAKSEFGVADSLLHAVVQHFRPHSFMPATMEAKVQKRDAKALFALTDAQVKKLVEQCKKPDPKPQVARRQWGKKAKEVVMFPLRLVVAACRERFGCLGYANVYRWKLKQRQEQRVRETQERDALLQATMKEDGVDLTEWPDNLDVLHAMDRWVQYGTGATLAELRRELRVVGERLTVLRAEFGGEWKAMRREAEVVKYVAGEGLALEALRRRHALHVVKKQSKNSKAEEEFDKVLERRGWKKEALPRKAVLSEIRKGKRPLSELEKLLDLYEAENARQSARRQLVEEAARADLAPLVLKRRKVQTAVEREGDMEELLREVRDQATAVRGRVAQLAQWAEGAGFALPEEEPLIEKFYFGATGFFFDAMREFFLERALPNLGRIAADL
jgi:hypothetical protein